MSVPTDRITWKKNGSLWEGTTEASDIGMPTGVWPDAFIVKGEREDRVFRRWRNPFYVGESEDRELGGYVYEDTTGIRITVYND